MYQQKLNFDNLLILKDWLLSKGKNQEARRVDRLIRNWESFSFDSLTTIKQALRIAHRKDLVGDLFVLNRNMLARSDRGWVRFKQVLKLDNNIEYSFSGKYKLIDQNKNTHTIKRKDLIRIH